jgi:LacI family transcriptional regulator
MRVTLKEIADKVGVSRPLVSFVLNNAKGSMAISAEKRQRIVDVARELGYIPNLSAQVLSGKPSRTIGLVNVCVIQYSVAIEINHFLNYAPHFGYQLLLDPIAHPLRELEVYRESMRNILSRGVDGLIFLGTPPPEILEMTRIPNVIVKLPQGKKEPPSDFDFASDLKAGSYLAGRHLLKHGHRKIVLLCTNYNSAFLKLEGLRQAWAEAGLPAEQVHMIEAFEEPAEKRILECIREQGVTCGLMSNDFIGARLMQFLDRNGVRVPEDFALIGFDGSAFAYLLNPPLTSVVSSFEENARLAFELLISRIKHPGEQEARKNQYVKPSMFLGGSCGCPWDAPDLIVRKRDMLFLRENMPGQVIPYDDYLKLYT